MSGVATAIAIFGADEAAHQRVLEWQSRINAAAARQPGFVGTHFTRGFDERDDWAAAVTFSSEDALVRWLESGERAELLGEGERLGARTRTTIQLLPGQRPPAGVAVILHRVAPENQVGFMQASDQLLRAARPFRGHLGGLLLAPAEGSGLWISVLRFEDDACLDAWLQSPARAALLTALRETLEGDFEQVTRRTPFGSIVRIVDGQARTTPKWRTAMIIFMVLFPTVMLLSRFVSPVLHDLGLNAGLSLWMNNLLGTIVLTWVLMPTATRMFAFWLDPVDGAPLRPTVIGAAIIVAVCAVTLVVFMSVRYLQFWDFDG